MTLLALDVECPKCGTKPNIRVTGAFLELVQEAPPEHVLGTWECQGPRCSEMVEITAGVIQRAAVPHAPALTTDPGSA